MFTPVRQRIYQRTAAAVTFQARDSTGELATTDPGTVTVTITRSDGTALYTDQPCTDAAGVVTFTGGLTAADTAILDILTATWTANGTTVIGVTEHEVVGGVMFTIAELRLLEPSMTSTSKYTLAELLEARAEVEASFESWTNMAWVPRFSVVEVSPAGLTSVFNIREVRWVRNYSDASNYTLLAPAELALIRGTNWGALDGRTWYGTRFLAGVVHGATAPPADLKNAAVRYCRYVANRNLSAIPKRAETVTQNGISIGLRRAGTEWAPTGIEDIDEVLRRPDIDHRLVGIG